MEVEIPKSIREKVNKHWPDLLPEQAETGLAYLTTPERGWSVNWRAEVENGETALYLFQAHRMSDPTLYRFSASEHECVGSGATMYLVRKGSDRAAAEQQMRERVSAFWQRVSELGLDGSVPMATAINTVAALGLADKRSERSADD